jgi:hypothetical protein
MVGHLKNLLRDIINSKTNLKKSDKLILIVGDDVIVKSKNKFF